MTDREITIPSDFAKATLTAYQDSVRQIRLGLLDVAWITRDGERIAKITPVGEADDTPPAVTVLARDAGISASEFMALPAGRRRAILDIFYQRLHGEQT